MTLTYLYKAHQPGFLDNFALEQITRGWHSPYHWLICDGRNCHVLSGLEESVVSMPCKRARTMH